MNILIWILTTIHVVVAAVLVVLVLMQKSSDQGVGAAFGGEMTETVFGGSITPLVKMTIYCAVILLATTLTLAVLHSHRFNHTDANSMINKLKQTAPAKPPSTMPAMPPTPALPSTPLAPVAPATTTPTPAPAPVGTPVPAPAK